MCSYPNTRVCWETITNRASTNNGSILIQDGKPKQIVTCKQQREFNISGVLLTAFLIEGLSGRHHQSLCRIDVLRSTASISMIKNAVFYLFKDEAQTALFKDPVRTTQ
jgi:hypothetical protein